MDLCRRGSEGHGLRERSLNRRNGSAVGCWMPAASRAVCWRIGRLLMDECIRRTGFVYAFLAVGGWVDGAVGSEYFGALLELHLHVCHVCLGQDI